MRVVGERCHACEARLAGDERFCVKCGAELPASPPSPEPSPGPVEGLAWSYRIPMLTNRYVWGRWWWAALGFGAGLAIVLGTPLVVMFADGNGGIAFAVKLYSAIAIIAGLSAIGLGIFSALVVANGVTTCFTLYSLGALATTSDDVEDRVEIGASFLGGSFDQASEISAAALLLLPATGEVKWKDVRRVELDESRHVITLRRPWHHPLRLYVPQEHFSGAVSFVRDHVTELAVGD